MTHKQALITGTSSGIGHQMAIYLAKLDIQVLGISRRQSSFNSPLIHTLQVDLTDKSTHYLIKDHYKSCQNIDYIVHCAGHAAPFDPLLDLNLDTLYQTLDLDVMSPLHLLQTLHTHLLKTRVLFIGSYSAKEPRHNWSGYSIGKASQLMFARCLQKESQTITVGVYYPGAVDTPIFNQAVSTPPTKFPDQPAYQQFLDTHTVKSATESAKEICDFLINSSLESFQNIQ